MRTVAIFGFMSMFLIVSCQDSVPLDSQDTLIDLTHSFDTTTIYWPTAEGFQLHEDAKGWQEGGYYYESNSFESSEHGGTHLDAPVHFAEGKWANHEIPLDRLIGDGIVVDVSDKVADNRDYQISVSDLQEWEAVNGQIPDDAIVLLKTGFGRYWPNRDQYLGTDLRGAEGVSQLHFPGLAPEAARWLRDTRSIRAVGIDTASIDYGQSSDYVSHQELFADNIPVFENVANLEALPANGFTIVALPMKIYGGSGGPLRIIAMVHN